jgi:hypothetical protein
VISEQPFITKLRMSSSPTNLDGLRRLRALQMSSSEIGAFDKNSEDCEREGNTPVQGFCRLTGNAWKKHQQLCRVLPNEYHQHQGE